MRTHGVKLSGVVGGLVLSFSHVAGATPATTSVDGSANAAAERQQLDFAVRVGLSAVPLVGYSMITAGWGETHTLDDGGWIVLDAAPAVTFWRGLSGELAVGAMFPVEDPWGYPDFRLALTPALRLDSRLFYGRLGVPWMFGEGTRVGIECAGGVSFWGPLYAGVKAFVSPSDLIILAGGLEIGARFDHVRLSRP